MVDVDRPLTELPLGIIGPSWIIELIATLIVMTILVVSLLVQRVEGQTPTIGPLEAIGFDYPDADLFAYEVNRFEAQYDAGAWTPIGLVVAFASGGVTTYKTTPTQTNGTHSVVIRACNQAGCGQASAPFAFAVLSAPSTAPSNLRKVPR